MEFNVRLEKIANGWVIKQQEFDGGIYDLYVAKELVDILNVLNELYYKFTAKVEQHVKDSS